VGLDIRIVRVNVSIVNATVVVSRACIGRVRSIPCERWRANLHDGVTLSMGPRCRRAAVHVYSWSRLRKSPLDGAIQFVQIKIRQPIVSKAPDPWLRCASALRETETSDSAILRATTPIIGVYRVVRLYALRRAAEIDIWEFTGVDGEVARVLASLGVDIVDLTILCDPWNPKVTVERFSFTICREQFVHTTTVSRGRVCIWVRPIGMIIV
jgi:hypothetical protein